MVHDKEAKTVRYLIAGMRLDGMYKYSTVQYLRISKIFGHL